MREYIIPNWHAILIHSPLGLLTTGLILEILTLLWRRSTARAAARWMIVIGAILAMPALTSGIYAYHDVITTNTSPAEDFQDKWDDLMQTPVKDRIPDADNTGDLKIRKIPARDIIYGEVGHLLKLHIIYNSVGLAGIFLVVVTFIGCSDRWRKNLYVPMLLILIASQGAIIWGSHHGGLLVYQQGAVVQPVLKDNTTSMAPTTEEMLMRYLPPAQLHFTLAGVMVGLAFVALGLAIRAMTYDLGGADVSATEDWFESQNERLAAPMTATPATASQASADRAEGIVDRDLAELRRSDPAYRPAGDISAARCPVPSARFWLLTLLAGVATFVAGQWLTHAWRIQDLRSALADSRNRWHIPLGVAIVVLPLILAFLARFARRAKITLAIFSFLLFAALALQIYVGILMTFDSPTGPTAKALHRSSPGVLDPFHWWPHEADTD